MEAKLTNNKLEYYQEGSTIMIGENLVTNPTPEQRFSEGYREVINRDGNGGVYVDGDFIIVETPIPEVVELTPEQKREIAYSSELIIDWDGKLRTCDEVLKLLDVYKYLGSLERLDALLVLWEAGRSEIQSKYADYE